MQPGREREAEDCFREAVQAGVTAGLPAIGSVLGAQPGRRGEAEQGLRLAAFSEAWLFLGALLADEPGRDREAEHAYRSAIEAGEAAGCMAGPAAARPAEPRARGNRGPPQRSLDVSP